MKNKLGLALVVITFATAISNVAHADATPVGFTIGGLGGLAMPSSASGASSRFSGGLVADYRIAPQIDLGAVATYSAKDENSVTFKTMFYGIESNYHIPALEGLAIGARLGFTNVK